MENTVVEMFLSEYFLIKGVTDVESDDERLFYALGEIFTVSPHALKELYPVVRSEKIENISSEKDFMQYSRIRKYLKFTCGAEDGREDEILNLKGSALALSAKLGLKYDGLTPRNAQFKVITKAAGGGEINALRILGVLQCEGIFFDKNFGAGIKCLAKSADWNDALSIAALLKYCPETRDYNLARLKTIVDDTPFYGLYSRAEKADGKSVRRIAEVELLEKAFCSSVLKREVYDPGYARIVYCKALNIREKEKVIFSRNGELVSAVADLPLKLSCEGAVYADAASALKSSPLFRRGEIGKIAGSLSNSGLRGLTTYRPLCICSRSEFLLNMYADAIKRADGVNARRVDAGDLTEYDFEPTKNNIFLRGLDEDKDNYCLLFVRGQVSERACFAVKSFLQSEKRGCFHINSPCITIDLRGILPVVFADPENAAELAAYCDVVELADVNGGEKRDAVKRMIEQRKKLYSARSVKIAEEVFGIFENMDIDRIESALDCAMRSYGARGGLMKLTAAHFKPFLREGKTGKIGFGGAGS